VLTIAFLACGSFRSKAAIINWTNTSGGDWSNAMNWDPNQVPLPADTAILNVNLAGSLAVPANAVLNWSGGDLSYGVFIVTQGGTLTISNEVTIGHFGIGGFLTNYGTVMQGGDILGYGGGVIYNAGLWQTAAANEWEIDDATGVDTFINAGTMQQIGSNDIAEIDWRFISAGGILGSVGSAFDFSDWTGHGLAGGIATILGTFSGTVAPGAVLNFGGSINRPVTISSNAVLNWFSGEYDGENYEADLSGSSLTVAQGGTLTITAGANMSSGFLTNYGTVIENDFNGAIGAIYGLGGSVIYNAGLWQAAPDMTLFAESGTNTFINAGTIQEISEVGVYIEWNFISDGGTLDPYGASFDFTHWVGNGLVGGNATILGSFGGTIASGSAFNFGGSITTPLTISSNAVLNWFSDEDYAADLSGSSLTVAQGGILTITNGNGIYMSNGFLTNYGTVIDNDSSEAIFGLGGSVIYNAGLWQSTLDTVLFAESGTNTFVNAGTLQQIGERDYAFIGWNFDNNGGTVVATGTVSFQGAYSETSAANLSLSIGADTGEEGGLIQFVNPVAFLGLLQASLEPGYSPPPGSVFQVLTYPSSTGGFGCMSLDLGDGLILQPQFNQTGLTLTTMTYAVGASQPQLFSAVMPNGLFLQWPASYSGWVLQSATNLAGPVWSPVELPCGSDIVVPENAPQQFFRLYDNN
jgi:hypothetical protein